MSMSINEGQTFSPSCFGPVQDGWWALVNALMNHLDPQNAGFLTTCGPVNFTVVTLPFAMSRKVRGPNLICD
jgi:hypothetical protein